MVDLLLFVLVKLAAHLGTVYAVHGYYLPSFGPYLELKLSYQILKYWNFEVHRNWLALTHNLTIDKWYYEETSQWTLDYPPFFAWLEYGLSYVAKLFDPQMLHLDSLNYKSEKTVLFQRLSVILLDFMYIFSVKSCVDLITYKKQLIFILLVTNPGLLMVDHIHFQYNGFLHGFLLLSMTNIIKNNCIEGAIWFTILLNLKHIFLYVAPVYVVYLLRAYCLTVSSNDGVHTPWYSFSIMNLLKLGATVIAIFVLSFLPFMEHLQQIISRLFPFKRGLSHAYWAPNFWALYNFADKFGQVTLPKLGLPVDKVEASTTGGLVQEFSHVVLPSVSPKFTFILTAASMVPALVKLWYLGADRRYRSLSFVRCLVVCATCSFIFGWHVHEKAILMVIIPLSFLSFLGDVDAKFFLILSTIGHYSLFPLLYPNNLLAIKFCLLFIHVTLIFGEIPSTYEDTRLKSKSKRVFRKFLHLPMLGPVESLYIYGFLALCVYENMIHVALGLNKVLPFLPLMITSVYCSVGVLYFWLGYYYYFLNFNLSKVPILVPADREIKKIS